MSIVVPLQALTELLRSGPPLELAVLFGSGATGKLRTDSDLDIGIVPIDPEISLGTEARLQSELERVGGREVDLVRLDTANTLLRAEAARDGKLLLQTHPGAFTRFRAEALTDWLEFAPAYRHAAETFRRRLIEAGGEARVSERDLLIKKLSFLHDHVLRLRERRLPTVEAFGKDRILQDAAGMSFVAAVQEAIDIAMHISADDSLGVPGSYAEAFQTLERNGILPHGLANRMNDVVKVRHRVVHGYSSVDFARFWREIPDGIAALEDLSTAIAMFAGRLS